MRNATLFALVTALALAAAGCDQEIAPPPAAENEPAPAAEAEDQAPELMAMELPRPLWKIDPEDDLTGWMLDDVSEDTTDGVPEPLRGLRIHPQADLIVRTDPGASDLFRPGLDRADFIEAAAFCTMILGGGGFMLDGIFESVEEQEYWLASLRAKEAVYGVGGKETACEREYFRIASWIARGHWWAAIAGNPYSDQAGRPRPIEGLKPTHNANSVITYVVNTLWSGWDGRRMTPEDRWPADPEAVERLKRWGVNYK